MCSANGLTANLMFVGIVEAGHGTCIDSHVELSTFSEDSIRPAENCCSSYCIAAAFSQTFVLYCYPLLDEASLICSTDMSCSCLY